MLTITILANANFMSFRNISLPSVTKEIPFDIGGEVVSVTMMNGSNLDPLLDIAMFLSKYFYF